MNMLSLTITLVQVTTVLLLCLALIRFLQSRLPSLSASLGTVGLLAANVVLLAGLFNAPRLLTFSYETTPFPGGEIDRPDVLASTAEIPETAYSSLPADSSKKSGLQLQRLRNWFLLDEPAEQISEISDSREKILKIAIATIAVLFMSFAIIRMLLGSFAILRLYRQSVLIPTFQWPAAIQDFRSKLGLEHEISIRVHIAIDSPCVHAFCRKVIFVPPDFFRWTPHETIAAFAHECSHLQRRDPIWRLFSDVLLTSIAAHPVAYLLHKQAALSQEIATDLMAAERIGSLKAYQLGLSRLMLRLDRPRQRFSYQVGFGVGLSGISSSLIRRIKMLDNVKVVPADKRRVLAMICATVACGCALLAGGWGVVADEPPRVATRPAVVGSSSGKTAEPKLFARPVQLPPNDLVCDAGFVRLDMTAALEHPVLPMGVSFLNSIVNSPEVLADPSLGKQSPSVFGFDMLKIQTIEVGIVPSLFAISEERRKLNANDSRFALTFGSSSGRLKTENIVDWKGVFGSMNPDGFGLPPETMKEVLANLVESDMLELGRKLEDAEQQLANPELTAMWNLVDGGFLTAALKIPSSEDLAKQLKEDDAVLSPSQQSTFTMYENLLMVGLGVDFQPGMPAVHVKIVIDGKATITGDELQLLTQEMISNAIAEARTGEAATSPLIQFFEKLQFETASDPDLGDIVILSGQFDPLLLAVMPN